MSLFDQLPILSAQSKLGTKAVLGPFMIQDYKPGIELLLVRNPNYWKSDAQGRRLPYLDSVRLPIQQNRETELARFRRGDVQLIDTIDPAIFDQLAKDMPDAVRDAGPVARFRNDVGEPDRQRSAARLQEAVVRLAGLSRGALRCHSPRRYLPRGLPRTRASCLRSHFALEHVLVRPEAEGAGFQPRRAL